MGRCEVCGNEYRRSFTVTIDDQPHVFDSFECAIHRVAPVCDHCGCRVIGHGVESYGKLFCCAYCARMTGGVERAARSASGAESREGSAARSANDSLMGEGELARTEEQQADGDPSPRGRA